MAHFLEKRDPWGNGLAVWVVAGMAFLIPLAMWGVRETRVESESQHGVVTDIPQNRAARWLEQQFSTTEPVLFSWEGSSLDDPRAQKLAATLRGTVDHEGVRRGGLKQIERVHTPQELIERMVENEINREDAIQRLCGVLVGSGKLRVRLTDLGRAEKEQAISLLQQTARETFGLEIAVHEPAATTPVNFATAAATDVEASATGANAAAVSASHDFQVSWKGMHAGESQIRFFREMATQLHLPNMGSGKQNTRVIDDCFVMPGSPIALAVTLSEAGLADRTGTLSALKEAAIGAGIPAEAIHMSGRDVSQAALTQQVSRTFWNSVASWRLPQQKSVVLLAIVVAGLLGCWMSGRLALSVQVLGVSVVAMLVSLAIVELTGGTVTLLLVALPSLVLVMTLLASLHMVNYDKRSIGPWMPRSFVDAMEMARKPSLWAGVAMVIVVGSLATSPLRMLRDFGMYGAIGMAVSLALVLYALPSLMQLFPHRKNPPLEIDQDGWKLWGAWIVRNSTGVLASMCIVCGVGIAGAAYLRFDVGMLSSFTAKSHIASDYVYLEEHLAGTIPVDVVVRFDKDAQDELKFLERVDLVRRIEDRMRQLPELSGVLSSADFVPAVAPLPENAKPIQKTKYASASRAVEERVKGEATHPAAALLVSPTDSGEFHAAGDELWLVKARTTSLTVTNYSSLTKQLDDICQSVLRHTSGQSEEKFRAAGAAVLYHPGASHLVAGMVPVSVAVQDLLRLSLINCSVLAVAALTLATMALLKNVWTSLLAMPLVVLPIAAVWGVMTYSGIELSVGVMAALSVGLGMAFGPTMHVVHTFRVSLTEGKSRNASVLMALGQCGPALLQTSCVAGLSFAVFSFVELVPLSRFGQMTAAMVAAVLVSNMVLTPSFLAGPLGALLERAHRRQLAEHKKAAIIRTELAQASEGQVITDGPHTGPGGAPATPHHRPQRETSRRVRRMD